MLNLHVYVMWKLPQLRKVMIDRCMHACADRVLYNSRFVFGICKHTLNCMLCIILLVHLSHNYMYNSPRGSKVKRALMHSKLEPPEEETHPSNERNGAVTPGYVCLVIKCTVKTAVCTAHQIRCTPVVCSSERCAFHTFSVFGV